MTQGATYLPKRTVAWWRRWLPSLLGAALFVAYEVLGGTGWWMPSKDFALTAVTIGGINVGFMGTIKAILFSVADKRIVRDQKDAGTWTLVVDYLMGAIRASFALVATSLVFVAKPESTSRFHAAVGAAIVLCAAISAFACYRVIDMIGAMMRYDP